MSLLCRYAEWRSAADQNLAGIPEPYRRVQALTASLSLFTSAAPFCEGQSEPVGSTIYWNSFWSILQNLLLWASLPPWSVRTKPPPMPNLVTKAWTISSGGSLDWVRKTQSCREVSSTMMR